MIGRLPPGTLPRKDVSMRRHSRWRAVALVAKRLLGAVVLGVATILLVKREPDQHWSEPPIITMVEDHDRAGSSRARS
jgi:hypothetical protein